MIDDISSSAPLAIDPVLQDAVRDVGIPARPVILDHIATEMRQPEPDFRRLATLISADVSLAAGLLKTANSAYFGFQTRARTVPQALVMLGLDVASRAIAGLILRKVFLSVPAMERFWDASARIAQASGWLVQQLGVQDEVRPDDAYTFGLFRDCGLPILMRRYPGYADVLHEANSDGERPFTAVEEGRCPTNHAIVGCLMAQSWWLPEETCLAIRSHHDGAALAAGDSGLSPASRRLIALSQLSEYLVQRVTGLSQTREWDKLGAACQDRLGLDNTGVEFLVREAPAVVAEVVH